MVSSSKTIPLGTYNSIKSVDGNTISNKAGSTVFIKAGKRTIGYLCPGWISTDAGPRLTYKFNAGISYILDCNGTPSIRVAEASP